MSKINAASTVAAFPSSSSYAFQAFLTPRRLALTIAAALSQAWVPAHAQTPTVLTSGNVGPAAHTPNPSASWTINNILNIGNTDVGTMSIADGGTVTNTGRGSIGESTSAVGTVTISGNASSWTIVNGSLAIGFNGKGTLLIDKGGKMSVGTGATIGSGSSSVGVTTVRDAGSQLNTNGNITLTTLGTGTLNILNGGVVNIVNGTGTLTMGNAALAGISSTLNIGATSSDPLDAASPGTLNAARITMNRIPATINFNHNSSNYVFTPIVASGVSGSHAIHQIAGTTQLTGNNASFAGTTTVTGGALVVANTLGGSAIVENGQFSVTGSFNGNGTLNGGQYTVQGSQTGNTTVNGGQYTLQGTQTGNATVNGGQFNLSGTLNGNATVSGAGSVAGTGAISGNLTFTNGGTLSGNQGATLSVTGAINLANDTVVNAALGAASTTPLFSAGNGLTLGGTLNVTDQGGFGAGVYRLFNYGGALTNNGMTLGTMPTGVNASNLMIQTSVIGQVNLASTFGMPLTFWDGSNAAQRNNNVVDGGTGAWRADGFNWTNASGALNGPYQPIPSFAVFQGAAGTVTVDQSVGAIGVTGMQFATDGYLVQGDPVALQGPAGQSTIRVGDGTLAGSGMTATISSVLTGASQLIKDDLGTLALSGNNLYTGGTDVHAGTLRISSDANLGDAASGIAMTGGVLATTASFDTSRAVTMTQNGQFNVASGTTLGCWASCREIPT